MQLRIVILLSLITVLNVAMYIIFSMYYKNVQYLLIAASVFEVIYLIYLSNHLKQKKNK